MRELSSLTGEKAKMIRRFVISFIIFFILLLFGTSLTAEPLDDLKDFLEIDEDEDIPPAKKIVWFHTIEPEHSITWAQSIPLKKDLRANSPAEQMIFAYDAKEIRVDAGFQYQSNQFDFATHIFYMPTFYNTFQAGIGINYHLYRYFNEFSENDFIESLRFRWIRNPVFSFEVGAGYVYKIASIDAVKAYTKRIYNFSYHFDLLLNWKIKQVSNLWFILTLQDYFDYPLAISPFYKLGFDVKCGSDLILGTDFSLKFVDMFFSAVYLNQSVVRVFCKVVF